MQKDFSGETEMFYWVIFQGDDYSYSRYIILILVKRRNLWFAVVDRVIMTTMGQLIE